MVALANVRSERLTAMALRRGRPCMLTESEEEEEAGSAILAMWRETLLQGGGRRLGKAGGGILYEAASRREKQCWKQATQQSSDYEFLTSGVCHLPKCSVEDERTKGSLARKDFVCDGTLCRHTRLSWGEVPVTRVRQLGWRSGYAGQCRRVPFCC